MNSKLTITLFTCSIIANSLAFAMPTDDIDKQIPPSSPPPHVIDDLEESPDFEFVLHEALRREVLENMKLERPVKTSTE
ncbi:hypothetical protein QPK87_29485 [Kamptonema cortianum]|jgi:hypothetical protein|nr:hypothetical protein [Geitlerinema splendidum]MDK3160658.1 hypothetical protein [Kamptonema cortianum]